MREMSKGAGGERGGFASCEPFALFIRFLLGTHKLRPSATRRPKSPLPLLVRGCKVAAKINGQIQLYLYLNVT